MSLWSPFQINFVQPNKFRDNIRKENERLERELENEMDLAEAELNAVRETKQVRNDFYDRIRQINKTMTEYNSQIAKSATTIQADAEKCGEIESLCTDFKDSSVMLKEVSSGFTQMQSESKIGDDDTAVVDTVVDCFAEHLGTMLNDELAEERKEMRNELEARLTTRIQKRKNMVYNRLMRGIVDSETRSYFDTKANKIIYREKIGE